MARIQKKTKKKGSGAAEKVAAAKRKKAEKKRKKEKKNPQARAPLTPKRVHGHEDDVIILQVADWPAGGSETTMPYFVATLGGGGGDFDFLISNEIPAIALRGPKDFSKYSFAINRLWRLVGACDILCGLGGDSARVRQILVDVFGFFSPAHPPKPEGYRAMVSMAMRIMMHTYESHARPGFGASPPMQKVAWEIMLSQEVLNVLTAAVRGGDHHIRGVVEWLLYQFVDARQAPESPFAIGVQAALFEHSELLEAMLFSKPAKFFLGIRTLNNLITFGSPSVCQWFNASKARVDAFHKRFQVFNRGIPFMAYVAWGQLLISVLPEADFSTLSALLPLIAKALAQPSARLQARQGVLPTLVELWRVAKPTAAQHLPGFQQFLVAAADFLHDLGLDASSSNIEGLCKEVFDSLPLLQDTPLPPCSDDPQCFRDIAETLRLALAAAAEPAEAPHTPYVPLTEEEFEEIDLD